jgi:TatD DNase family protein
LSYVDAHLHLADPAYADKIESILEDAAQHGVGRLFSSAVDYETSVRTVSLAKQHEKTILPAIGLHPWTVVSNPTFDLTLFERLLDENRQHVKAIGEIGLDGKYTQDKQKREAQREVFRFFLRTAERRQLAVVVHSRLAVDEVLDELSRFSLTKVLLHWYDGPVENLSSLKERGYFISVGPALLYSKRIAQIARNSDLSMLLTETDGPVEHHGPFKGKMTRPSFVIDVARELAKLRSEEPKKVRDIVWNNFQRLAPGKDPAAQV